MKHELKSFFNLSRRDLSNIKDFTKLLYLKKLCTEREIPIYMVNSKMFNNQSLLFHILNNININIYDSFLILIAEYNEMEKSYIKSGIRDSKAPEIFTDIYTYIMY